jgi:hypothetical protein
MIKKLFNGQAFIGWAGTDFAQTLNIMQVI